MIQSKPAPPNFTILQYQVLTPHKHDTKIIVDQRTGPHARILHPKTYLVDVGLHHQRESFTNLGAKSEFLRCGSVPYQGYGDAGRTTVYELWLKRVALTPRCVLKKVEERGVALCRNLAQLITSSPGYHASNQTERRIQTQRHAASLPHFLIYEGIQFFFWCELHNLPLPGARQEATSMLQKHLPLATSLLHARCASVGRPTPKYPCRLPAPAHKMRLEFSVHVTSLCFRTLNPLCQINTSS